MIVFLLISAAAVCFCAQYPAFERNARDYKVDILQDDEFLTNVYQGNLVFYRELAERVKGGSVNYRNLFLQVTETQDKAGARQPGKTWMSFWKGGRTLSAATPGLAGKRIIAWWIMPRG